MTADASFNHITGEIIGAAIEVHRVLGPGLLESTYMPCLEYELGARKLRFVTGRTVPIVYKGIALNTAYRIDLLVEDIVIVELKSVERVLPVHQAQVLTYLHLTGCPLGLLINFNVAKLVDGVSRLINTRAEGSRR
jgi:GxxExxY protein